MWVGCVLGQRVRAREVNAAYWSHMGPWRGLQRRADPCVYCARLVTLTPLSLVPPPTPPLPISLPTPSSPPPRHRTPPTPPPPRHPPPPGRQRARARAALRRLPRPSRHVRSRPGGRARLQLQLVPRPRLGHAQVGQGRPGHTRGTRAAAGAAEPVGRCAGQWGHGEGRQGARGRGARRGRGRAHHELESGVGGPHAAGARQEHRRQGRIALRCPAELHSTGLTPQHTQHVAPGVAHVRLREPGRRRYHHRYTRGSS